MYSRFRDGLLSPSSIIDYIKDKWGKTILQLLLYALLLTIPIVISTLTYEGIEYDQKLEIMQEFNNEVIPFEIINGELKSKDSNITKYEKELSELFKVKISLDENVSSEITDIYTLVFKKDKIVIMFSGFEQEIVKYNDVEGLKNIDLSLLNKATNANEWDVIFSLYNGFIKDYLGIATILLGVISFFENVVVILFIALIISFSFIMRFSKLLKYNAMYKMSIYYTAPFVVGSMLASLFGIALFYYLGVILSIVYSIIGSNVIISRLMNQGRK